MRRTTGWGAASSKQVALLLALLTIGCPGESSRPPTDQGLAGDVDGASRDAAPVDGWSPADSWVPPDGPGCLNPPVWTDTSPCSCSPTPCGGCDGTKQQHDGCGNTRDVACSLPATGCAGLCCAGACCAAGATCQGGSCCKDGSCCKPTTCAAQGAQCGTIKDGCGGTLQCGTCVAPLSCGAAQPNQCGLTPNPGGPYNVVVLMLDDLDVGSFQALLSKQLLPGIQTYLLQHGTRFDEAFVTNSSCCPSRASFLTGQYCHNHHVYNTGGTEGGWPAFRDYRESNALPMWLKTGGYTTGMAGKYFNAYGTGANPFPANWAGTSEVSVACPTCKIPPGWDDWNGHQMKGGDVGRYAVAPFTSGGKTYSYVLIQSGSSGPVATGSPVYHTDKLKQLALKFIDNAGSKPFFLYLAPIAVHTESGLRNGAIVPWPTNKSDYLNYNGLRPAPRHVGTLAGKLPMPQPASFNNLGTDRPYWFDPAGSWWGETLDATDIQNLKRFYQERMEAMLAVDEMVAAIGQRLVQRGSYGRTLLVLVSDNGYQFGEHRTVNKQFPYEESIRVPLVIRAPGVGAPKAVTAPVLVQDLTATILDYAGASPAKPAVVDGRTLRPLLEGKSPAWRKQILVEHWYSRGHPLAFYDLPDYGAVRTFGGSGPAAEQVFAAYYDDKNIYDGFATGLEHYRVASDPLENTNLALAAGTDRATMHMSRVLGLLRSCQGSSCRQAEDLPLPTSSASCETVSAASVRVLYDALGKPQQLRQHIVAGGLLWTRTGTPGGSWNTTWQVADLGHLWGQVGTSAPGVVPTAHPSVEGLDAFVVRERFDTNLQRIGVRQIAYWGEHYWRRDSLDTRGSTWPSAWTHGTLPATSFPWTSGPYAADFRPLYSGGKLSGFRQVFIDSDDGVIYSRDSDDAAGNSWSAGFSTLHAAIDSATAYTVHPVFDGSGARKAMRQLAFMAGQLWSRQSSDADGKSWPGFTQSTLSGAWGGNKWSPPTTTSCN